MLISLYDKMNEPSDLEKATTLIATFVDVITAWEAHPTWPSSHSMLFDARKKALKFLKETG